MKIRILKTNRRCPRSKYYIDMPILHGHIWHTVPSGIYVHTGTTKKEIWEDGEIYLHNGLFGNANIQRSNWLDLEDKLEKRINKPKWQFWRKR